MPNCYARSNVGHYFGAAVNIVVHAFVDMDVVTNSALVKALLQLCKPARTVFDGQEIRSIGELKGQFLSIGGECAQVACR